MLRHSRPSDLSARSTARRRGGARAALAAGGIASLALVGGVQLIFRTSPPQTIAEVAGLAPPARMAPFAVDPRFLERKPALGPDALKRWSNAPLSASFRTAAAAPALPAEPQLRTATTEPALPTVAAPVAETARIVLLPPPRPAELRTPETPAIASRDRARKTKTTAVEAEDNRSFLEKLFGVQPSAGPTPTYAALESGRVETGPAPRVSAVPLAPSLPGPAVPKAGGGVAVYDISAQVVTLPNGEKLEAHSGLGDKLDDPRFVHVRMRGATPPGTYELTEREEPFHGVRALRLNPVGGSAAVHGRAGLLAHTFMLGPNGQSNGCVSFRDYERFLQAYLRGEVRQLVVVAGKGDGPGFLNRLFGTAPARPSESGRDA